MNLFEELKRRNVFRVGVTYIVASWVLLQVADLVLEAINAPDWVLQAMLMLVVLGFIAAMIVAWAYEITPDGIKRESEVDKNESITRATAARLDRITIGLLVAVVAIMLVERFVIKPAREVAPQTTAVAVPAETTNEASVNPATAPNSVAVLPFVAMSQGIDDEYFADGLTEEILNALAQLPELLVTARTSSFHFKGQNLQIPDIAAQLGVRNIVEGSVRRSGDRLRVTAQLVRAADGFHLWSENYDSTAEDTIQVQEDIAEKIALALDVVLDDTKREAMRASGLRDVEAFITMQKARKFYADAHGDADQQTALRAANELYEQVLARVPDYSQAHIEHSDLYVHLLNDNATGNLDEGVTEQDLIDALAQAQADMTAALANARNFSEQNNLEIDLAFLTGNWRGILSRTQRFSDDDGCDHPTWAPGFALPFGDAVSYAQRLKEIVPCDPMSSLNWFNLARAHLWAGDPAEALRVAHKGKEVAPGGWLTFAMLWTLVANGEFEEIDYVVDGEINLDWQRRYGRILKYAAMGETAEVERLMAEVAADREADGFWTSQYFAWAGHREDANRHAALIDQRIFGPQALILSIYWCQCGAPFDLEATPNFAARLEQAGLAWPPPSPIKWPLKGW